MQSNGKKSFSRALEPISKPWPQPIIVVGEACETATWHFARALERHKGQVDLVNLSQATSTCKVLVCGLVLWLDADHGQPDESEKTERHEEGFTRL